MSSDFVSDPKKEEEEPKQIDQEQEKEDSNNNNNNFGKPVILKTTTTMESTCKFPNDLIRCIFEFSFYKYSLMTVNRSFFVVFQQIYRLDNNFYKRAFANNFVRAATWIFNSNVFPLNFNDNMPLMKFCEWGNEEIVKKLVKMPEIDVEAGWGYPLRVSLSNNNVAIIRSLLGNKGNRIGTAKKTSVSGYLKWACKKGRKEGVRELLEKYGIECMSRRAEFLVDACKNGNVGVLREVFNFYQRNGVKFRTIMLEEAGKWACIRGFKDSLMYLINVMGLPANFGDDYAIRKACLLNQISTVKELLEHECVNPMAFNHYCIRYSVMCNHLECLKLIILDKRRKINPSSNDNMALKLACMYNRRDVVEFLFSMKNLDNSDLKFVLLVVIKFSNLELFEYVMGEYEKRVISFSWEYVGEECLIRACKYGKKEIVKFLLDMKKVKPSQDCVDICKENNRRECLEIINDYYRKKNNNGNKKFTNYVSKIEIEFDDDYVDGGNKKEIMRTKKKKKEKNERDKFERKWKSINEKMVSNIKNLFCIKGELPIV